MMSNFHSDGLIQIGITKSDNQETHERHVKNFLDTEDIDGTELDGTG